MCTQTMGGRANLDGNCTTTDDELKRPQSEVLQRDTLRGHKADYEHQYLNQNIKGFLIVCLEFWSSSAAT